MDKAHGERNSHVLVLPLGDHSHITPLVHFSKDLARRGITITFVCVETEVSRLNSEDTELRDLDIRFFGIPDGIAYNPSTGAKLVENGFQPLREKLIRDRASGGTGPTCLICDMFNTWTTGVASELQIPWYSFFPSGATTTRLFQVAESLFVEGKFPVSNPDDWKLDVDGLPALRFHEVPLSLQRNPPLFRNWARINAAAAGVLINTFYELDSFAVDKLRADASALSTGRTQKFYTVGPRFTVRASHSKSPISRGLQDSQEPCLRWLDSQPESSVLYICFGSVGHHEPQQLNNLALALESCNQRFLWVIREPATGDSPTNAFPPGFEARIGERGCFVRGWAPQLQVLSHPSTGGFLTHCGWNSSLEAVSMGVPMIGWPIGAEQFMNCRLLVDLWKIAAEIRREEDGFDEQKEIKRAVQLLMVEEEGKLMRTRVKELATKSVAALQENGSTSRACQEFVEDIKNF